MISEFLSDFGNLLLLILAGIILYFLMKDRSITYYISKNLNHVDFERETREILQHSNVNLKYKIREVDDQQQADITIELRSRESLNVEHSTPQYYPGTNKQIRFSFTWQRPKPYIAIDEVNWTHGVDESGLSIKEYRKYVIQHEFLHALGYDHQPCNKETAVGGVCPILYQSTRGPPTGFKSGYEIQPIDYTKKLDNPYF